MRVRKLITVQDSFRALAPVVDITQAAWPFTPVDKGDENGF